MIEFVNKTVKQGNSLCVRVPSTIVQELKLKEGSEVVLTIKPMNYLKLESEKAVQQFLETANKIKKLDKYSDTKKKLFIILNYQFIKTFSIKNENKKKKAQTKFMKEKKKEFGSKLIDEFLDFAQIFREEAFAEGDELILKQKYR